MIFGTLPAGKRSKPRSPERLFCMQPAAKNPSLPANNEYQIISMQKCAAARGEAAAAM